MIRIAICDDSGRDIKWISMFVRSILDNKKETAEIKLYNQSTMLKYDMQDGVYFDIILSDIDMPELDGMELAYYIKKYLPHAYTIFVTAYTSFAVDSFELDIFRFIPKDDIYDRLKKALCDVLKIIHLQENLFYILSTPSKMQKIPYREIYYIRRCGKNVVFHLNDNQKISIRSSLSQVFKEFDAEEFLYIDRGTIVNINHVMGLNNGLLEMEDGMKMSVSYARLSDIKDRLYRYWGKQL